VKQLFRVKILGLLFAIASLATLSLTSAEGNHKGGHGHNENQGEKHGDDHGVSAHWMSPKGEAEKPNQIKSDASSIERGKKSYATFCATCHGATAMGDGIAGATLNPKPTNLKAMSGGHPDGDFAWKIANGRGARPAWKSVLKEDQIWDLVNYIQNLKNSDNDKNKKSDEHSHEQKSHDEHTH
jgi:mono/diheme cytochrome c family protein